MSDFWGKFNEMMDALPGFIDETIEDAMKPVKKRRWWGGNSVSTTVTVQNGHKIVTKTVNGKTTITVDGKEYIPKEKK